MPSAKEKRFLGIVAAAALTMAVIGVISGSRPPVRQERQSAGDGDDANRAASYGELREGRRGRNGSMYDQAFSWLRGLGPSVLEPVVQTEEERQAALALRRERRAYAGAPPVIPHPVQERGAAECLACHGSGSLVGALRAPMMSHKEYSMCVQCHATQKEESTLAQALGTVGEENLFVGVSEAAPITPVWEGAPPVIPHPTFMRETCSSCHGPYGAQGLRTPHPDRASCSQCHASGSDFDQNLPPSFPPTLP